jgi:hypothetical protein
MSNPNVKPSMPGQDKKEKPNPQEQAKERQRKHLEEQQQQIQKRLDTLKTTSISKPIRDLATRLAVDPELDPNELFRQIRPLLSKMGIANFSDASRTELVTGKTRKTDSMYKITMRRNAIISSDTIDRIKRNENNFESMQWSSQAIEIYLWYPYKPKEEAVAPGTPPTPNVPPTPGI